MYVCNFGGKGRNLTLQGNVIDVTFVLQSSFFCLATKERSKEKFKAYFFLLLASFTSLKGRNSLRSNSLPFFTLRYGSSLDGEKSRPGETMRMGAVIGGDDWLVFGGGGYWGMAGWSLGCWVLFEQSRLYSVYCARMAGVPGVLFLNMFCSFASTRQAFWLSASWMVSISIRLLRRSGSRTGVMASMRR